MGRVLRETEEWGFQQFLKVAELDVEKASRVCVPVNPVNSGRNTFF